DTGWTSRASTGTSRTSRSSTERGETIRPADRGETRERPLFLAAGSRPLYIDGVNNHLKTVLVWLVFLGVVVIAYQVFATPNAQRTDLDASEFYRLVDAGEIQEVNISPDPSGFDVQGKFKNPHLSATGQQVQNFHVYTVKDDVLMKTLRERGVVVKAKKPADNSMLALLITWAPLAVLVIVWIVFMRQMPSGGNKAPSFRTSRAKLT